MEYTKRENSYWIFSRELKDSNKLEGEEMDVKNTYKEVKLMDLSTKSPFVTVTGKISNISSFVGLS